MSGTFLGTGLGGGFFPAAGAPASPVTPPAPTSEAVASGGSVTGWTFGAFTDPDSRIVSYSATLTAVVGSGSLSGSGLGPYLLTGTADGDSYTVELDALDSGGAVLATATHSVNIGSAGIVTGSFVNSGRIKLDGVDEKVDFGHLASLVPTTGGTWSVSAWFVASGGGNGIYALYTPASSSNYLIIFESGAADFYVELKLGGQLYQKRKNPAYTAGTWNHVLVTSDGTDFRVWVNGSEITSWTSTSGSYPTATETWNGTEPLSIGALFNTFYTAGEIANVAVWSTDQAANVAAIYALDRTGDMRTLGTPPDLLYVPFKVYGDSETAAGGISDLSGNSYDGSGVNLDGDELLANIGDSR